MLEAAESHSLSGATGRLMDRLASARAPALVVAPMESRLVAANEAGARLVGVDEISVSGLCEATGGVALDSAMPAILQLRRMVGHAAAEGSLPQPLQPLIFWTPRGAARLLCRVRVMRAGEPGERTLLLVEPISPTDDAALPHHSGGEAHSDVHEVDGDDASPGNAAHAVRPALSVHAGHDLARAGVEFGAADEPAPIPAHVERRSPPPPDAQQRAEPAAQRTDADILRAIARQILAPIIAAADPPPGDGAADGQSGNGDAGSGGSDDGVPKRRRARQQASADVDTPSSLSDAVRQPATAGDPQSAASGQAADAVAPVAAAPALCVPAPVAITRRLAHELKSPLSAIAAAAEIMRDERFGPIGDERYLRYARDIHDSARHAIDVIESMLGGHTARPSDPLGLPEQAFTDVDVNALVVALLSSMEPLATDAGVTLDADLSRRLPRVVADGTSLRQMILNLVANALKFSPRGSLVTVETRADVDGPLSISVADRGPGMSAAEIARVMDAVSSAEIAPRKGGGFGIGLPLVRSLAAANGAELRLTNRAAGGLVAEISFPKSRQVLV
ncbi:MAG: ATP-binding protein [Hyphomicrobiaceae bacterium]